MPENAYQDADGRWYREDTNERICGAKTRRGKYTRCHRRVNETGRCRMHGGASLRGVAHPNWQGKGRSKYMPTNLRELYEEAQRDDELDNLRNDLALVDARLRQVLTHLSGEGMSAYMVGTLRSTKDELLHLQRRAAQARRAQDLDAAAKFDAKAGELLQALFAQIDAASDDTSLWIDIDRLVERRAKLIDGLRRQLETMHNVITAERAMVLVATIIAIINDEIKDVQLRRTIAMRIQALITADN